MEHAGSRGRNGHLDARAEEALVVVAAGLGAHAGRHVRRALLPDAALGAADGAGAGADVGEVLLAVEARACKTQQNATKRVAFEVGRGRHIGEFGDGLWIRSAEGSVS